MLHSLYEQPSCCREASLLRHCRLHSQRIRVCFGYMCHILGARLRNVNSMLHYTNFGSPPEQRVFLRRHVRQAELILRRFAYGPSWLVTKRMGFGGGAAAGAGPFAAAVEEAP